MYSFKSVHGYKHVSTSSSLNKSSPREPKLIIPAGVYCSASHHNLTNSLLLFCFKYSEGSFKFNETILHFFGEKICATFSEASLPYWSLSKQITILSNPSKNSNELLTSLTAPLTPDLILTQAYLLPNI